MEEYNTTPAASSPPTNLTEGAPAAKPEEGSAVKFERRLVSVIQGLLDAQSQRIDTQLEAQRATIVESHDKHIDALDLLLEETTTIQGTLQQLSTRVDALEMTFTKKMFALDEMFDRAGWIPRDGQTRSFDLVPILAPAAQISDPTSSPTVPTGTAGANPNLPAQSLPPQPRKIKKAKVTPIPRFAAPRDTLISPDQIPETSASGSTSAFMTHFMQPKPLSSGHRSSDLSSLSPPPEEKRNSPSSSSTTIAPQLTLLDRLPKLEPTKSQPRKSRTKSYAAIKSEPHAIKSETRPRIAKRQRLSEGSIINPKRRKEPAGFEAHWPPILRQHLEGQPMMVMCDSCDNWFHSTCLAMTPEDPRLAPDTTFICPRCEPYLNLNQPAPRSSDRAVTNDLCNRPDCPGYGKLFVIESFIGRRARRKGEKWDYLVKWDGYPIVDALWKDFSDLPETSQEFVDKFHAAVLAEGQIINDDVDLVLLESARSGGWPRSITIKHEHI